MGPLDPTMMDPAAMDPMMAMDPNAMDMPGEGGAEEASPQPQPPDNQFHLNLAEEELRAIATRIEQDYQAAISDHDQRMKRWTEYYHRWRNMTDPPAAGEEDASNFRVPFTQWSMFTVWSQIMSALLGDDAEVVASAQGPSDQQAAARVGVFMTWRLFSAMKLALPLTIHMFRTALFGRAFAYTPYVKRMYKTPEGPKVAYEGPGFYPEWPNNIIVPAEDVQTVQQFSWAIRRYWASPQQLLDGEREGRYFGIEDRWEQIVNGALNRTQRSMTGDDMAFEKDAAEGVTYDNSQQGGQLLEVWEWYGRRRLPLDPMTSPPETDVRNRAMDETDLMVRYLPQSNGVSGVIGVQDLMECYPHMEDRRPISETALIVDGSYWSPGVGELVEMVEEEASADHNLFQEAAEFAIGPLIFCRPGSGIRQKLEKGYGPRTLIETDDPTSINQIQTRVDLSQYQVKQQAFSSIAERVLGRSDLSSGRGIDRPNSPKTATGTVALLEAGNLRVSLDMLVLREHLRSMLERFWQLDRYFSPRELFFRVTETDADGLWDDVRGGFATLTDRERRSNFDFQLKFATSVWSKAQRKQDQVALYQVDLQNPLVATNPRALWAITDKLHKAMGDDSFGDLVPMPPQEDRPRNPREEWTLALQAEDFDVHPADNDDQHMQDHWRRVAEQRGLAERDEDAVNRMLKHIVAHEAQKVGKQLMQQAAAQMVGTMGQQMPQQEQEPQQEAAPDAV